jgi:hypothetical protein
MYQLESNTTCLLQGLQQGKHPYCALSIAVHPAHPQCDGAEVLRLLHLAQHCTLPVCSLSLHCLPPAPLEKPPPKEVQAAFKLALKAVRKYCAAEASYQAAPKKARTAKEAAASTANLPTAVAAKKAASAAARAALRVCHQSQAAKILADVSSGAG